MLKCSAKVLRIMHFSNINFKDYSELSLERMYITYCKQYHYALLAFMLLDEIWYITKGINEKDLISMKLWFSAFYYVTVIWYCWKYKPRQGLFHTFAWISVSAVVGNEFIWRAFSPTARY